MTIEFQLEVSTQQLGLYVGQDTTAPNALQLFYLAINNGQQATRFPAQLSFTDSWREYDGGYLFAASLDVSGSDLPSLVQALGLLSSTQNKRFIAWVSSPVLATFAATVLAANKGRGHDQATVVHPGPTIPFGNVDLTIHAGSKLTPDFDDLRFDLSSQSSQIVLERTGQASGGLSLDQGAASLSFDSKGAHFGGLQYTATQWDAQAFLRLFRDDFLAPPPAWGGEVRYFYADQQGFQQLVYPLFVPFDPNNPSAPIAYSFDVQMHPLFPNDSNQTAFVFQPGQVPPSLASSLGRLVTGAPVTLTPLDGVGFYLGVRPKINNTEPQIQSFVYLAPFGQFQMTLPNATQPQNIMCGLSGLEYLRAYSGDVLELVPAQPAFAPLFGTTAAQRAALLAQRAYYAQLLTADYTTSWIRFVSQGTATGQRGYFAQPNTSINYALGTLSQQILYPTAVSSFVSDLSTASEGTAAAPSYPMVVYGGIYPPPGSNVASSWVNQGVDGMTFEQFEQRILTIARHRALSATNEIGPVFQSSDDSPLTGRTVTPQGLLVQLNDGTRPEVGRLADPPTPTEGTWQQLILARNGEQFMSIDADPATGYVNANLSYALMNNQVFAVLNNWAVFQNVHSQIAIDPFSFDIRPANVTRDTLLVFKYLATKSLTELINEPEVWADPEHLIGSDPALIKLAQQTLLTMLQVADRAKGDPNDPFVYFRDVVATQPTWTGILAVNAFVGGTIPDMQMLFAGIDGPLLAHHFGVELNQIQRPSAPSAGDSPPQPEIQRSAMFGAIWYEDTTPPTGTGTYDFSVRELIAAFKNSTMTQFNAMVGMTINQLFGRDVTLVKAEPDSSDRLCAAPNMLCINGKYQRDGAVGTVTFALDAAKPQFFRINHAGGFIRVVDRFHVTGATLVPIDDQGETIQEDGAQTIRARFSLNGEVLFNASPFPSGAGLDFFSYGLEDGGTLRGLPLQGLAFDISFQRDKSGKRQTTIAPYFVNIIVSSRPDAIRDTGLLNKLPLKLTDFLHDDKGLSSSTLNANPMHTPQLMQSDPQGKPTMSFTTSQPTFALRFELPLGSLGALSDVYVGLNAGLVLAWGPSEATPDNDGAAVFVQLPQLSAGVKGFDLQGLIRTTFGDANLIQATLNDGKNTPAYAMLFNNVALSIFGIQLPPSVIIDFILFSDPSSAADSNIAWSLAAAQTSSNSPAIQPVLESVNYGPR